MDEEHIRPLTLAFASPRLEARYWRQYLPKPRVQLATAGF